MVDKSKVELRVGAFVFFGFLVLMYIVFSIGDFYIFSPGYRIKTVFDFADGIEVSSPVRYAGVEVGRVEEIEIFYDETTRKNKIALEAWIQQSAKIEKDAECYINTLGLLGEKYLEILPGTKEGGLIEEGGTLTGNDTIPMEKIKQKAYEMAVQAQDTLGKINKILDNVNSSEGTIGKLLTEDKIYNDLSAFVEDIKKNPWKLLHKPKQKKEKKKKR